MKIAIYLTLIIAICAVMPPQTPIIGVYTLPDDGEEPPING